MLSIAKDLKANRPAINAIPTKVALSVEVDRNSPLEVTFQDGGVISIRGKVVDADALSTRKRQLMSQPRKPLRSQTRNLVLSIVSAIRRC